MPYFQNATSFLVEVIFNFALYTVLIRFWMQWVRADFRNQLGQFIIKATNTIVIPLRKLLPSVGLVDTATVVLAAFIALLKITAIGFIFGHLGSASLVSLSAQVLITLIVSSIYVFLGAIWIGVIFSWIGPQSYHPIASVARSISEPLVRPVRKLIPPIAGLDFSSYFVIIALLFSQYFIIDLFSTLLR